MDYLELQIHLRMKHDAPHWVLGMCEEVLADVHHRDHEARPRQNELPQLKHLHEATP